jgi:hypothetical protein
MIPLPPKPFPSSYWWALPVAIMERRALAPTG